MKGKSFLIPIITSIAIGSSGINIMVRAEDETKIPASVSGYVSSQSGDFTLIDSSKTPVIYVDDTESEAVKRAAVDLCSDITKVTDIEPVQKRYIGSNGFTYADEKMTMTTNEKYETSGMGIAAAYDKNGVMTAMSIADAPSADGNFIFSKAVNAPEKGSIKGFIWDSLNGMKPLTSVITQDVSLSEINVIIGTVGNSNAIDKLVSEGKLDVSDIKGKWESFKTQVIDDTLVIAGSDKRGTIYGIYDLSEKIGVSPWYWWADVPIGHADGLYINLNQPYVENEPSVKYRGIFLNDEQSLKHYADVKGDGDFTQLYEHIFELLLRLKANYLWPAMHETSPAFHKNPVNAENADRYGIVMGSSHCEMFLRNNTLEVFEFEKTWVAVNPDKPLYKKKLTSTTEPTAYIYTDKNPYTGAAVYNKEFIRDYWKDTLLKYGRYDNIYNVGMRGLHDEAWAPVGVTTAQEKARQLEEIITMQRALIKEVLGKEPEEVSQMFIPYKEIQEIYDSGMDIPEDITLMWTDDNYGNIRQLPTLDNYHRKGGAGIYYHLSYHGNPNSYLWLGTTPLAQIREEMVKAYDSNAKDVWVANVGDIKPAEKQIEYFLDLARNIDDTKDKDLRIYMSEKAMRDFGMNKQDADEYADISIEFDKLASSRKPELFANNLFSYNSFGDEGQQYVDKYANLTKRSELLVQKLDESLKPAFFELQLYPLRSCYNTAKKYVNADKSNLYFAENRGAIANKYAQASKDAYSTIAADTTTYNKQLNSKWDRIMDPFQDYWSPRFSSCNAIVSKNLTISTVDDIDYTQMQIAAENMNFSGYSKDIRFIDIYNSGGGSFDWKITSDENWVKFNKTSGTVYSDDRIWVAIDWDRVPQGTNTAKITVSQVIGESVILSKDMIIEVSNSTIDLPEKTYAESNGFVSIEAEHYTSMTANGEYTWQMEKDLGRSGDSLKAYPNFAQSVETPSTTNSSYVDYNIYFESTGTFDVDIYRMPTLNERGGTRFAIGLDDDTPVVLSGTKAYTGATGNDSWSKGVMANNETLTTKITVSQSGYHTLRLYNMDTGVIIDKMVITTGEKVKSYFGAPESYNSTYNNIAPELPQAPEIKQDGSNCEFKPDVVTVSADIENNILKGVKLAKVDSQHDNVKVTAAIYGENGAMINSETKDVTLSEYDLKQAFDVGFNLDTTDAQKVSVIVYDDAENMQVLAPAKSFELKTQKTEAEYNFVFKQSLANYIGKQSIVIITPYDSNEIVYIAQERIGLDSYKTIPANVFDKDKYTIKVGIYGDRVLEKTFYTIENYQPDNNGVEANVYMQGFDKDIANEENVTLSGSASYSTENSNIKMNTGTTGGSVTVVPNGTVGMVQGQKTSVISDIAYGKLSSNYMDYKILDSKGIEIVNSHISAYSNDVIQSLKIGGEEFLTDKKIPSAITADNSAMNAGYMRYNTVIDPASGSIVLTITNQKTKAVNEYIGVLPQGVKDIGSIVFTTTYTNSSRSCYIDNVSVSTISDPQYGMTIFAEDKNEKRIDDAEIIITDDLYGTKIAQSADGRYMLCEGTYNYSVNFNGEEKNGIFEVFCAMESNQIVIKFDTEYTNDLTVEATMNDYSENQDEELYVWDFATDQTGSGKNVPVLSGGAYYDSAYQSVSLSASSGGGLEVSLADEIKSGATHKAIVEFDMAFGKESGKYSYYTIYDTIGNELVKLTYNEYNNRSSNQKLDIGGTTVATGGSISNCTATVSDKGMKAGLTHFKNVLDFDTNTVSISISSANGSATFKGTLTNTTGSVAKLAFTSNHTNSGRNTYVDNIKLGLEAVEVQNVALEVLFEGTPVDADITITNTETAKQIPYENSGVLLRAGTYRYNASYGGSIKSGTFKVSSEDSVLAGKLIYAFGDSIVYGHTAPEKSFMRMIADENKMILSMCAQNGASIIKSQKDILTQVKNASTTKPDFIVFDGYTNDAYEKNMSSLGTVQGNTASEFDETTFCGGFEKTLYTMKQKWGDTPIIFVTIHKSAARDWEVQCKLRELSIEMCEAWGVNVVDIFADTTLDTRNEAQMAEYIIDGDGSHPNEAGCREFYMPLLTEKLITLCEM